MNRLLFEVATLTLAVVGVVLGVLLMGQVARVGDLLWAAGDVGLWARALSRGSLIMLEAALPLAGMVGAGLAYGRLRAEGAWVAWSALGRSPGAALWPAAATGGVLAAVVATLSPTAVPTAITELRGVLVDAVQSAVLRPGQMTPLPGGGAAMRTADGGVWAVLPGAEPTLVHAASARVDALRGRVELGQARLVGPETRVAVERAVLQVERLSTRRLAMLGPPNALPSAELDPGDVHHRFTWYRRWAMAAMAPFWAVLGALLGARLGGSRALVAGAAGVGLAYGLLRMGELTARAGLMSPALAAWAPVMVLGLVLGWAWARGVGVTVVSR